MDNQKQRKSAGTIALVVLLLIVTIASLILATYAWAKYTTRGAGSAVATVAKWDVQFTKGSTIFTKTYSYVVNDRLAPGTSGQYTMSIKSPNTEVNYAYEVTISNVQNRPTNLKFYGQNNQEITFVNGVGTIWTEANVDKTKALTDISLKWEWPYETATTATLDRNTQDDIDTRDGVAGKTMTFDVTLRAWQLNPGSGTANPDTATSAIKPAGM